MPDQCIVVKFVPLNLLKNKKVSNTMDYYRCKLRSPETTCLVYTTTDVMFSIKYSCDVNNRNIAPVNIFYFEVFQFHPFLRHCINNSSWRFSFCSRIFKSCYVGRRVLKGYRRRTLFLKLIFWCSFSVSAVDNRRLGFQYIYPG